MSKQNKQEKQTIWEKSDTNLLESFCADYRSFISRNKTERECVADMTAVLKEQGAKSLADLIESGETLQRGDLVYADMMKKALLIFRIGEKPVTEGMRFLGAHIDSPRMDLKQNPLYENTNLALFETHYYGGIKKYQWTAIPLALHGRIVRLDGEAVDVCVGEDEGDPCFVVSDLLPHLAREQASKPLSKAIEGESLNVLIGSRPFNNDKESEQVMIIA